MPPNASPNSQDDKDVDDYIPSYLRRHVFPYQGDFCVAQSFHPALLAHLMVEGFLPIAAPGVLLPKLHQQRSVIQLPMHVSRNVRRKSKQWRVTLQQDFQGVVQGCQAQHGPNCWLYPVLVDSFAALHAEGLQTRFGMVRLYSVELWNEADVLVAGELGYTVGDIYTSLTGFSSESSSGSVQLAVLGCLLEEHGFTLWDLGMDMDYKRDIGATLMSRKEYVQRVQRVRESKETVVLPTMAEPKNAREILDAKKASPDESMKDAQQAKPQADAAR